MKKYIRVVVAVELVTVAQTPDQFQPTVYNLIRNLSENVILPIAGIILTFIACYELIQLVIAHNNLANFETWIFFKWVFKTFIAVTLITNTFNITMAVFDVAQHVVSQSGSLIAGTTAVECSTLATMQSTLEAMDVGPLFGIFLQSFAVKFLFEILSILIWAIVYGRMIEIYRASRSAAFHPKAVRGHFGNPALASR